MRVCFDIESTGTDLVKDRIIKLTAIRYDQNHRSIFRIFCNPQIPIPPGSTKVHGITDEMVQGKPPFEYFVRSLHEYMNGCDLAGFGIGQFDITFLWEHFYRAGIEWRIKGLKIYDGAVVMKRKEERTLSAASRMYLMRDHANAHDDLADAETANDVLLAQMTHYPDIGTWDRLAEFSKYDNEETEKADLAGKILRRKSDGVLIWNFTKQKGNPVKDDPGLIYWVLDRDFPESTKLILRKALREIEEEYEFNQEPTFASYKGF